MQVNPSSEPPEAKPTFGLVMIVKNGAHTIRRILNVASVFDQIVVVDTGSTDGTPNIIAKDYPHVQLERMEWPNHFGKARNFAHKFLKTDYWMWLDADDTFDDPTQQGWLDIVKTMQQENLVVGLIPYLYLVDDNGVPLIVQYRERIFRGTQHFEWREAIHEVCVWTGDTPEKVRAFQAHPVVHRPEGDLFNERRNWRIIVNEYLNGNRSDRILYYMARECNVARDHEWAIELGKELVAREPGGYYEYEGLKAVGEAYAELYKRDKIAEYYDSAVLWLTKAIRYDAARNDARAHLIDLYMFRGDADAALAGAYGLNESMPATPATMASEQYGTYRDSCLALIYLKHKGNAYKAMIHHMKALDTMRPNSTCVEVEKALRSLIEDRDIGIVYCDELYNGVAVTLRQELLKAKAFREVWIFNDPKCLAYARRHYIHLTDDPKTLYQEDGHPRLLKHLFSNRIEELPYGYDNVFGVPTTAEGCRAYLDAIINDVTVFYAQTLEHGLRAALTSRASHCQIIFHLALTPFDIELPATDLSVKAYYSKNGDLLGIAGSTENLCALYLDGQGIVRVPDVSLVESVVTPYTYATDVRGRFETVKRNGKDVVFVAPGIEDWDGTTPYRWGIGASESTLIYVAEKLAQRGYTVRVYTTVSRSRTVAGVYYLPQKLFSPDLSMWDLLIASRMPEVLSGPRKAKRQVLWMHDVAEAYVPRITDSMVIDRYVCVSEWQKERGAAAGLRKDKLVVIPNGVRFDFEPTENSVVEPKRTVWISQPERGIHNIFNLWRTKPEEFSDFWAVYGFYNYLNYRSEITADVLREVCMYKHMLRTMGGKIVGRVSAIELRRLLHTCDRWVYPSVFAETFCVSGLEAAAAGLKCYLTHAGATVETMQTFAHPQVYKVIEPQGKLSFDFAVDGQNWLNELEKPWLARGKTGPIFDGQHVSGRLDYENITKTWEELIDGTI